MGLCTSQFELGNGGTVINNIDGLQLNMQRINFYTIVLMMTPRIYSSLLHQDEKSDVFISPYVRLCGYNAMAYVDSEFLVRASQKHAPNFYKSATELKQTKSKKPLGSF